jgi:hypothetical protein
MNSDLPGGLEEAEALFRSLTSGQTIIESVSARGTRLFRASNGTQLRINPDGSVRIERLIDVNGRTREIIHFNPLGDDSDH